MSARLLSSLLAAAVLLAACDSPSDSRRLPPARLDVVSGNEQRDTVGQELSQPLVVRVVDERGRPVADQVINFRVTAGNGSVFAGSASTNRDGEARERWTLGTVAGDTQRVEARAVDSRTGAALVFGTFWAVGAPDAVAALIPVGAAQTGTAEDPLADSLAVRAADRHGNAVAGVQVSWAAAEGGGTLSPATSTTDAAGIARSRWTLGPVVGGQAAQASAPGAAPARLTATAGALPAVRIQITPRDLRFVSLGDSRPLSVVAYNRNGAAVGGLPVTLSTDDPAVAGVNTAPAAVSAGNGTTRIIAALGDLRDTVPVTVRQVVASVRVAPDSLAMVVGASEQLTVRVADANNRPVQDAVISFASSTPAVATVSSTGLVRGVGGGRALVTVSSGFMGASLPVRVYYPHLRASVIGAGSDNGCAVDDGGRTLCWGRWHPGVTAATQYVPTVVGGPRLASIDGGTNFSCGLTAEGAAYCWGANNHGQLGNGSATGSSTPVAVSGGHRFSTLTVGDAFTCGLTAAGAAWCWGGAGAGQIGNGQWGGSSTPAPVSGGHTFTSLSAGDHHACGVASGTVYCWGLNRNGEVGVQPDRCNTPDTDIVGNSCHNVPVPVSTPVRFRTVAVGFEHSCGLATDGGAYCWGGNSGGRLGIGRPDGATHTPTAVAGGHTFASLMSGTFTICGTTGGGETVCWGTNTTGEFGNGTTTNRDVPVVVDRGRAFTSVAMGFSHACGISEGIAYCWGGGWAGQLGALPAETSLTPKPVMAPD